ncbi:Crp/Fnr family transcriptional regulator [Coralliovum pocilloporae]|uniref:Crp/Fnr family transcriptional regulator n=1 Tax=Coralliovum pocilloporae TaxID=3066369 RepID=UPI0033074677
MTLNSEVETLKRVPLFNGIDAAKLKLLAFISDRLYFSEGEHLCDQGEDGDSAYIIMDGAADVVVETPNGPAKVAEASVNDVVGEIAILCDVPRTATVVAASDMETLAISKDNFLKLLREFPDMSLEVMRVLGQRLDRMNRELVALRSQRAE